MCLYILCKSVDITSLFWDNVEQGCFKGRDIYINKPVFSTCMENMTLDCRVSYCWDSIEYFKDLYEQSFEFGTDYIKLCDTLLRVFVSNV